MQPLKPIAVGDNLASNLKQWKKVWQRYVISAKEDDVVRLSILLSVIWKMLSKRLIRLFGAKARRKTLLRMLTKFAEYCEPRTQIIHERFSMIVNKREVKV